MVPILRFLTAALAVAFGVYMGAWLSGALQGNAETLLLVTTCISGLYWVAERWVFKPRRRELAEFFVRAMGPRRTEAEYRACRAIVMERPWWLHVSAVFPLALVLCLLRACVWEPMAAPSSSMSPTLRVGDMALINKYAYGLRVPLLDIRLTQGAQPRRGDVIAFQAPLPPQRNTIKRIVGLPGDEVTYRSKHLWLNGQPVPRNPAGDFYSRRADRHFKLFEEQLDDRRHRIIHDDARQGMERGSVDYPLKSQCRYAPDGVTCRVPPGHYFVMADNRDYGQDTRLWGFVPARNVIGKVFFVWMNFENLDQIGIVE